MPMEYWKEINDRLNMVEVVRDCGLYMNRANFVCCPFHNEKTPSMKIYDKSYYCFGCHLGGKAIDFVSKYYNLQFKDACRLLNQRYALGLEDAIDGNMSWKQKQELKRKIAEDKRQRDLVAKEQRIENGHIECSDIDDKYENLLYDTIIEPSFNELLKANGLGEYVDHKNSDFNKPNVVKVFKYDKVGTEDFDRLVNEFGNKAQDLWQSALLNKKIREEEQNE